MRPGDPLADLVYILAMSKVLRKIEHKLEQLELLSPVPHPSSGDNMNLCSASYVDDVMFPVMDDAPTLYSKTAAVQGVAHDIFTSHGMPVNYAPGKTEALAVFFKRVAACESLGLKLLLQILLL